jgi:hypothetical protein
MLNWQKFYEEKISVKGRISFWPQISINRFSYRQFIYLFSSDSDKFNLSKRTVKTKNVSKNLDSTVYKNESAIVFNEPSSAVQSSFVNESFQTEKGELQSKSIVYSGMNYTDSNAIEKQINSAKNETRNVTSSQTKYV